MTTHRMIALFLLLGASAHADYGFAAALAPMTYASPSGRAKLLVDPSARSGAGGARYELKIDGKTAWSGERELTLWKAAVADDGTAAGYAYSTGYNDLAGGDFVVVMLSSAGKLKVIERVARKGSSYLHTMPDPRAEGVFLDPENARFVVRVADPDINKEVESWWSYALSDGKPLPKVRPKALMDDGDRVRRVIAARPVASTPLTLVHWYRVEFQGKSSRVGARFTLLDVEGRAVWTLDWPEDYELRAVQDRVWKEGAILDTSRAGRFELHRFAGDTRETFAVAADPKAPHGWCVKPLGSASAAQRPEPAAPAQATVWRKLERVGAITLGAAPKSGAFDDVSDFDLDDRGRFGVVANRTSGGKPRAVFIDESGRALRTVELPRSPPSPVSAHVVWLGGERWLVSRPGPGNARTTLLAVDLASGAVETLPEVAGAVGAIASDRAGGFVALVDKHGISDRGLVAFEAHGRRRWSVGAGMDEALLFAAEDVTVTPAGEAVVLENIAHKLKIFGKDGKHRATVDLEKAWGREPRYPTAIAADGPAGVVIHDFDGDPPVIRAGLGGRVRASFAPCYANGGAFEIHGRVLPGRDGRLWTSDGHALVRLDHKGVVDRIIGSGPDPDVLGRIERIALGPGPTIHAMDERTGAVHVFDAAGKRLHVARPDVSDYAGSMHSASLAVTDAGDLYAKGQHGFVHYSRDGKRVGTVKFAIDSISQDGYAQRGSARFWVLGYEDVSLVDAAGVVVRKQQRAKDGRWLNQPNDAAVAPDGSIAILLGCIQSDGLKPFVAIYGADGEPLATWDAPQGVAYWSQPLAFDGEHVALMMSNGAGDRIAAIAVLDAAGNEQYRIKPETERPAAVFLVGSGEARELWVFDGERMIARYAMP